MLLPRPGNNPLTVFYPLQVNGVRIVKGSFDISPLVRGSQCREHSLATTHLYNQQRGFHGEQWAALSEAQPWRNHRSSQEPNPPWRLTEHSPQVPLPQASGPRSTGPWQCAAFPLTPLTFVRLSDCHNRFSLPALTEMPGGLRRLGETTTWKAAQLAHWPSR